MEELADTLTDAGFDTVQIDNVQAAETYVRRERPEFAIIDLGFPDGSSGLPLVKSCSELGIRIIVLSGETTSPRELGRYAHTFISKPVPHEIVKDVLVRLLLHVNVRAAKSAPSSCFACDSHLITNSTAAHFDA